MQALLNTIDTFLGNALNNPYVNAALTIFFVLYAGLAAPNLHPFIASLFDSNLFKLLILFLILAVRNYSTPVALLAALGFLLSLQSLGRFRLFNQAGTLLAAAPGMAQDAASAGAAAVGAAVDSAAGTMSGESETSESSSEASAEAAAVMGCGVGPSCQSLACGEPLGPNGVLPPHDDTAVSGVCGCDWQGPQGLKFPVGFNGPVYGAEY